ncbi:MAG: putative DNA binding domain-containing protein [Parachlamydiaceae bacterium]|nr:putative DNA binding domain-containing protein [Parachlamydiaceae bacterium]
MIGVDSERNIVGISEDELQRTMEYLDKSIFESCAPPIIPTIYTQRISDKFLLIIEVSTGMSKPYFRKSEGVDKGTYIRLGRSTVKATGEMIEDLKWQSRGRCYDMMPVYQTKADDLDKSKILDFLNSRKAPKVKSVSSSLLSSYDLTVEEHSATYSTVGGILLFGKKPQGFFSEASILCTHFSGISGREALGSIECVGTLLEQFYTAHNFIVGRLSKSFSIRGIKREEELEVPEAAIREMLLNAVIHRNYHIDAPTKIAIYDNRIEFFTPGVFPGPLDTHNLKLGLTFIRNKVICRVFREAGLIEKLGSGFITLFDSYEKKGLAKPEVIEGDGFVKCILPRPSFGQTEIKDDGEMKAILGLFELSGEVAISDVMQALQFSRPTAGRRLTELIQRGLIEQVGRGKGTRYRIVENTTNCRKHG